MLLERITEPPVAYSPLEILSFLREGDQSEASLIDSFLYEGQAAIELLCERAVSMTRYRLRFSSWPYGIDNLVGPEPHTRNRYYASTDVDDSYATDMRFGHASPPGLVLEMVPVRRINSIQYYDEANSLQTLDAATYQLLPDEPAIVSLLPDNQWPAHYHRRDAITVDFWAGETDRLIFDVDATQQFRSASGFPWQNGDSFTLRVSGPRNAFLGDVAVPPVGFTENQTYYVVEETSGSFNLSTTTEVAQKVTGTAVTETGKELGSLYTNRMSGVVASGLRKIATDSYMQRCGEGECSCSGMQPGDNTYPMHIRKMRWRPVFQTQ